MLLSASLVLLAASLPLIAADGIACSATLPCEIGCCGRHGVCGMGPNYCASDVCINNCGAKAECNPGNWPDQYVNATTCPLNVCCSDAGFCGTTEEFCGDSAVTRPSCDVSSHSITRVIGYYSSGGASQSCGRMLVTSFPQGIYSHIYFAYGSINPNTFEVIPASAGDKRLYPLLEALQTRDLGQQLWLSIGGWDFSDSNSATATTFSGLAAANITSQNVFFASLTRFMATWGFTGVDIDWEYPGASDRNGRAEDYVNFPIFLSKLKAILDEYRYGLSITLPISYRYLQHFDLVSIEPSVDWFNFKSYNLHATWDSGDRWTGPIVDSHTNLTEIETALDLIWRNNIPPSKVNLGLAFYGRSFTLESSSCSEPGCTYLSAGDAGKCSAQAGILLKSEIEQIIRDYGLTPKLYEDAAVKTITWNDDQWAAYDDQDTWKIKADFAKSQCLGGVFVWLVNYEDRTNPYSEGLATALGNGINLDKSTGLTLIDFSSRAPNVKSQDSYCRFANCGETCPSGFTQVSRSDKKPQIMLDSTQCPPGSGQTQTLCCPTLTEVPACQWRGFHTSGKCTSGCNADEAELGTASSGCSSGYQSACCTITESTKPWYQCAWTEDCRSDDTCPSGYRNFVANSRQGWGGRSPCTGGKKRNYCCVDDIPDAFTNCDWYGNVKTYPKEAFCSNACPSGSIRIAAETVSVLYGADNAAHSSGCLYGAESYCCFGGGQESSDANLRKVVPSGYKDRTTKGSDVYSEKLFASPEGPLD